MLFELNGGTRVLIRHIEPGDKHLLEEGLARLSEETIRKRVHAAKPRLSSSELRYLSRRSTAAATRRSSPFWPTTPSC